jgi:hypothetical protein
MKQRIRRAGSIQELLSLLESGVKDLGFDSIEILYDGKTLQRWFNSQPLHPETARVHCENRFEESRFTVKWVLPTHDDETYNEYLMLTWYSFLVAFKAEMVNHTSDLSEVKNNVLTFTRKLS